LQPGCDIKAGAGFVHAGQITMAENARMGISPLEPFNEGFQGAFLFIGAAIMGKAAFIQPADIANPNRALVIAAGMGADGVEGPAFFDAPIAADNRMIADIMPAPSNMPVTDFGGTNIHDGLGCGTMNNNKICGLTGQKQALQKKSPWPVARAKGCLGKKAF